MVIFCFYWDFSETASNPPFVTGTQGFFLSADNVQDCQKFARASVETKIQNCLKGICSLMSYQCLAALFECYFFRQVSKYSHILSYIRQAKVGFTMPIHC